MSHDLPVESPATTARRGDESNWRAGIRATIALRRADILRDFGIDEPTPDLVNDSDFSMEHDRLGALHKRLRELRAAAVDSYVTDFARCRARAVEVAPGRFEYAYMSAKTFRDAAGPDEDVDDWLRKFRAQAPDFGGVVEQRGDVLFLVWSKP